MPIKRVMLIIPPAYTAAERNEVNPLPPLGLGYLAATLTQRNIHVNILDCLLEGWEERVEVAPGKLRVGLTYPQIMDRIRSFNPDVVGLNCQFSRNHVIYHQLFSLVKKATPRCLVLAGGAHATVCPDDLLSHPDCDFILMGEAEESLGQLVETIDASRSEEQLTQIDGLGYRVAGKPMVINPKVNWIKDLDSLPFPDYDTIGLEKYFGLAASHGLRHLSKFSPIITSRGCPAKCTFCTAHQVWGRKYRTRSVGNVIQEMRLLRDKYGVEELMFEDDNLTANAARAKSLFKEMIKEGFGFTWDTPNGVAAWTLDNETLELMKASGCININFPVESGSARVLKEVIKKPLKLGKIKNLCSHCREIDLAYGMFLVIGMPGETLKEIWQSIKFAADCQCYSPHISIATPYPGSELWQVCEKNNYWKSEFNLDDLFIRSFMIQTEEWKAEDLKKILFRAYLYLRWRLLIRHPISFIKWLYQVLFKKKNVFARLKTVGIR